MDQVLEPEKVKYRQRLDELKVMFPVESPVQTLGHRAVTYANQCAAIVLEMSQYDKDSEEYKRYSTSEGSYQTSMNRELGDIRQQLASLRPEDEVFLNRYLSAVTPPYLMRIIGLKQREEKREITWKEWLTQLASPEELLFFLQYHNQDVARQQTHPVVAEALAKHRQDFVEIVDGFYKDGHLSKTAPNATGIQLKVGDIFSMAMKEMAAFHKQGVDEMYIQQGFMTGKNDRVRELLGTIAYAATHELVHATLGESLKSRGPMAARWFNEAMTESIAIVIDRKTARKDRPQAYEQERLLLHQLFSGTPDTSLAYKLAMRAYTGTKNDRGEFLAYLDMSWGPSVLQHINSGISEEEYTIAGLGKAVTRDIEVAAIKRVAYRLQWQKGPLLHQSDHSPAYYASIAAQE